MEDIDAELLIYLVEARPVLWDKFLDKYKDRNLTKNAWSEVCEELRPDYDDLDVNEKNAFAKEVLKRWTNLRDSFSKYKKKSRASKKSGTNASKIKKYIYYDQLQFLSKLYDERETDECMDQSEPENAENESRETYVEDSADANAPTAHGSTKSKSSPKARKHKKPDESEQKSSKASEDKPCSKMAFLQSLMPHLQKFDEEEFLNFQMDVLNVIRNINEKKKAMNAYTHPHPLNFSDQLFRNYPQSQFNPSTSTQFQQFFTAPPIQPPFYSDQLKMHGPYAIPNCSIPNQSRSSQIRNKRPSQFQEISSKRPSPAPSNYSLLEYSESEQEISPTLNLEASSTDSN